MPMPTGGKSEKREMILHIHRSLMKKRDLFKIIDHLKLTFMAERPPPSQFVQKELLMAAEERGEYF